MALVQITFSPTGGTGKAGDYALRTVWRWQSKKHAAKEKKLSYFIKTNL